MGPVCEQRGTVGDVVTQRARTVGIVDYAVTVRVGAAEQRPATAFPSDASYGVTSPAIRGLSVAVARGADSKVGDP